MQRREGRFAVSELAVGVVLLALAGVILFDAQRLAPGSIYGVGPNAAPVIVAAGLILLGLATLLAAWRGGAAESKTAEAAVAGKHDRVGVVAILGGLAALMAVIGLGGGFVIATTILFAATAWAFGRRSPVIAVAIGLALSIVVYSAFTFLLSLSLPQGPVEDLVARAYRAMGGWVSLLWQRFF
jgi:putative tricarboxylic transport membrane protein